MMKRTGASGTWVGGDYNSIVPSEVKLEEKINVGLPGYKFSIVLWASENKVSIRIDYDYRPKRKLVATGALCAIHCKY
jgi:hypothetical protein